MDRWVGKVAVVTGASAGIGAAIAASLVKEGLLVVGLARRLEKLEKLSSSLGGAKGKLYARECDVSNEEDLLEAFEWIKTKLGGVDILVNNAGVVTHKRVIDDEIESFRNILNVNFLASAISVKEAVASMLDRKVAGHVINMNSILGHPIANFSMPTSVYSSSKYAVTALTESVRKELAAANSKIKITSLSPGIVATEIFELGGISNVEEMFAKTPHLESKDIADAVLYILGTPENVQITELTIRPTGDTA